MSSIAGEHGQEPKVAEAYADFFYEHLDQTDESDLNFLMRIAKEHDALATVKGQTLLLIDKGEGETASGLRMLPLPISKSGKLSWSMTLATRGDFNSVDANWHNEETGQKEKVAEGGSSPIKKLRHTCATREEAQHAAKAELDKIKRGSDTLSMTMQGNLLIAA